MPAAELNYWHGVDVATVPDRIQGVAAGAKRVIGAIDERLTAAPVDTEILPGMSYIAMPGQALSYMTGRMEIEALRARAESTLGDAFDIKAFHDLVLASGALPLAVLGEVVDDWIAEAS